MIAKFGLLPCLLALALAPVARASTMVETFGRADIVPSGGISVTQDLSFKAQVPSDIVLASDGIAKIRLNGVRSEVSLAVPSVFDLTRAGGMETLTVNMLNDQRFVVGGALRGNGSLSVDISGRVGLLGAAIAPGAYHGFLVVVAQYN
jgi:hypothetical protein